MAKLDGYDVINILSKVGYVISKSIPPKGFKMALDISGPLANKGEFIVDVDTRRHILGLSGPYEKIDELSNELLKIEETFIRSEEIFREPYFYEALAELELSFQEEKVDIVRNMCEKESDNEIIRRIRSSLGEDICTMDID